MKPKSPSDSIVRQSGTNSPFGPINHDVAHGRCENLFRPDLEQCSSLDSIMCHCKMLRS